MIRMHRQESFDEALEAFKNKIPSLSQQLLTRYTAFTGLEVPASYQLPLIELSPERRMQKLGAKLQHKPLLTKLAKQRKILQAIEADECLLSYTEALYLFIKTYNGKFAEAAFEELDNTWLNLRSKFSSIEAIDAAKDAIEAKNIFPSSASNGKADAEACRKLLLMSLKEIQLVMEALYAREYEFAVCGNYSFEKDKIFIYLKNIEGRFQEDALYVQIPYQQAFESILAHEIFHSLHLTTLQESCCKRGSSLLKLFNPIALTSQHRELMRGKRRTVLESCAKYFEYAYARDKGYREYAGYEKNGFVGRRRHFPFWPYAGAKALLAEDADEEFREILRLSLNAAEERGFSDAYAKIEENSERILLK